MPTPEAVVKRDIRQFLTSRGLIPAGSKENGWHNEPTGWFFMPVPSGLGVHGIPDFVGGYRGRFFALEAKAPGELSDTSPNQERRLYEIETGGGFTAVADCVDGARALLERIDAEVGRC